MTQDKQSTSTSESSSSPRRWHRDASGTYEVRQGKDGTIRVRIATTSIKVVEVLFFLPCRKIELLLEFTTSRDPVSVSIPLECLADERLFLTRCPAGAVTTAELRAYALLRELLVEDIPSAKHVAVVTAAGWFIFNGKPIFVHAGGYIHSDSVEPIKANCTESGTAQLHDVMDINVACSEIPIIAKGKRHISEVRAELPPNLSHYRLQPASSWTEAKTVVREVLRLMDLATGGVMYLVIAIIFATAIQNPRLAIFLYGPTGTMKTQLALILSSFFGANHQERHLASYKSTENALRARFASTSNLLVGVDDYVELNGARDGGESARKAEGLIRSIVNQTGKERANSDGTLRTGAEPKGLMVNTGEQLPSGLTSLRKRSVNIPIDEDTFATATAGVRPNRFDAVQEMARKGVYAQAMASFLAFSANFLPAFRELLSGHSIEFQESRLHRRHQDAARWMLQGFDLFLTFARALGACNEDEAMSHQDQMDEAVGNWHQRELLEAFHDRPTERFTYLLQEQLLAGRCHIAVEDDALSSFFADMEITPEMVGYRAVQVVKRIPNTNSDDDESTTEASEEVEVVTIYRPQGTCIGSINYHFISLYPGVALGEANRLACQSGDTELPGVRAMGKSLVRENWLAKTDADRNAYTVTIGGKSVRLWVIPVERLFEPAEDWGTHDVATFEHLSKEEAAEQWRQKREKMLQDLRDSIVQSQVKSLLNGALSITQRDALAPPPFSPGSTNADEETRAERDIPPKNPSPQPQSDDPFDLDA